MSAQIDVSPAAAIAPRPPWRVVLLIVVTLSIYTPFWYYKVNRDMRNFGAGHGDEDLAGLRPARSTLAVTIGGIVVIPRLVSFLRTVGRVRAVERLATGESASVVGVKVAVVAAVLLPWCAGIHGIGTVLSLAGFASLATACGLLQARLNAARLGAMQPRADTVPPVGEAEARSIVIA